MMAFSKITVKKLFFLASILLMLTDCHCQRRQIVVRSVLLEMPTTVAGFTNKPDREKFSDLVKMVVEKDEHFHFDPKREDGEVLHLALIVPAEVTANSSILLAASLEKAKDDANSTKAFADVRVLGGRISGNDVSEAVTRVLQSLTELRSKSPLDSNEYLKKIEEASLSDTQASGELINAITVVTQLRDKKAEASLIRLLEKTTSLSVGNACIVALGDMQSADGMSAIINFAERKPPILRRQAIMAARKIATKQAAEWLLVMAFGHDDPVVRDEARAALAEVDAKLAVTD
jgi:hypothetical protein